MTVKEIFERLAARAGHEAVFAFEEAVAQDGPRDAGFQVRPEKLLEVMRALRDEGDLAFDFLQNLTAVDWPKRDVIQIVYHLFSYRHRHSVCVRVDLPRSTPRVDSLALLWPTANWHEREQYDLLGVVFEGHPDLRRLLMPDDWVGHPMRKDFHEPKSYRGMPTSRPSPLELLQTYDRAHVAKPTQATAPPPTVPPATPEGSS